jgi:hypothetical protein
VHLEQAEFALIVRTTSRQGIPDAVQDIYVKHKTDRTSWLTLKSYETA